MVRWVLVQFVNENKKTYFIFLVIPDLLNKIQHDSTILVSRIIFNLERASTHFKGNHWTTIGLKVPILMVKV